MDEKIKRQNKNVLVDSHGRTINYLRLSVTDRCNLKCQYCHPPHKIEYLDRSNICSYKELLQVVRAAAKLGIEKIRLTGGELFLRRDIDNFISSLYDIDGIKEVVLTTNGTLLLPHLKKLKEIGLRRINISLDTLSENLYYKMTGGYKFHSVLDSIHGALSEGFKIKINMVVLKGINEEEIPDFINYFLEKSVEVRFIEFMPLCGPGWDKKYFLPLKGIKEVISQNFQLQPLSSSGVAQEFFITNKAGLEGKVGIIAPVTCSFCSSCSRIRLSANGELRPCLFSRDHAPLLPLLRSPLSQNEKEKRIIETFQKAVKMKPIDYSRKLSNNNVFIRSLGG